MRGRIVLFVALAVVIALVGFYAGWSTSTPEAGAHPSGTTAPSGHKPAAPPASQPKHRTEPLRFGAVTTSGADSDTGIASDRRALTTTFSDLEVTVGNGEVTEPDAARSFSMTLPSPTARRGRRSDFTPRATPSLATARRHG